MSAHPAGGPKRPPGRRWSCNLGRVAAAKSLVAVEEGSHLEDELARRVPKDPRDRGLAWFLAFGVLRRRGGIDAALQQVLTQPLGALEPGVRATLRLGAFEKEHGRAGAHAVVNEWVEATRAVGAGRASNLVNAVLRRVGPAPEHPNHPAWLADRWAERYGEAAAHAWLRSNEEPPPLFVVAPNGLPADLAAESAGDGVFVVRGAGEGTIADLPGFREGAFWVQDRAAVQVADLSADGLPDDAEVLDACAAPGGKSFRLASRGRRGTAVARDADRRDRVQEGAKRLGFTLRLRQHDWLSGPAPGLGRYAAVLVDAPCSGLGTVRRHPEIRWRRQPEELLDASDRQRRILTAASAHVEPGGWLTYAVCSPDPEESDDVVDAFLAGHPGWEIERRFTSAPPAAGEDAHTAVRLRAPR